MRMPIRCLRAPNPSPMTYSGTNTYLLGEDTVMIIDPGPVIDSHKEAILTAIGERPVSHIIVTHAHLDHTPLARPLADQTGAPVVGFGPATAGRSAVMAQLAAGGFMGGGEGVDTSFAPDVTVADGDQIRNEDMTLNVLHTPGHMGNHISLAIGNAVFTGDLVMGWASSLVSPPDGDLTDFLASCRQLIARAPEILYPGHGDPVTPALARINWLIAHRESRSAQIIQALAQVPMTAAELTTAIYTDTDPALHPAAQRNVLAHLVHLTATGAVAPIGPLRADASFERVL